MKLTKKYIFIFAVIIIVIIIAAGYFIFSREKKLDYEFIIARKGNLIQEVSVTGKVKPAEDVNLAFEKNGKISSILVKVGDRIKENETLIVMDSADLSAQLDQARAKLKQYQAGANVEITKLNELKKGARVEEIKVKESELAKAKQDLANYYVAIYPILNDAYNKANDAIVRQTDEMFSNDFTNSPQLTFVTINSQAETDSEWQRVVAGGELSALKSEIDNLSNNYNDLDNELSKAKNHLSLIKKFLISIGNAVDYSANLSQSVINTYKSNLSTASANVNLAITSMDNQEQFIAAQKIIVEKIQNELNLKLAGSTSDQIATQEFLVSQAEANISAQEAQIKEIEVQVSKTVIHAPISGIITKQEAKIGEIISANQEIISIISASEFEIEANVTEADIAKIKIGDQANTTLDAYGNSVIFKAKITAIDPAETIVEGIATYKTTFQFLDGNGRIRSGMTANIDILADSRGNIIVIPQRSIITKNNQEFVRIVGIDENIKEVPIKSGLRGSDGNTEIIEGINEGDKIIIFIKD